MDIGYITAFIGLFLIIVSLWVYFLISAVKKKYMGEVRKLEVLTTKTQAAKEEYETYTVLVEETSKRVDGLKGRSDSLKTEIDLLRTQKEDMENAFEDKKSLLTKQVEDAAQAKRLELDKQLGILQERKEALEREISIEAEEKKKVALLQAQRDIEEKSAELRMEFEEWIQEHLENFSVYKVSFDELKKNYQVAQQKLEDEAAKENFVELHSLKISQFDYDDIETLQECRDSLHRKSVLDGIVWTAFVQEPMQKLRKALLSPKLTDKKMGIYRITNTENNKCYIGQAVDIGSRWVDHAKAAVNGSLKDKFHEAMRDKPLNIWTWEVLEECGREDLNKREKFWIDFFQSNKYGYNSTEGNR